MRRPEHGFTLIELVVTVAIVGVLAAGALPLAQLAAQRSQEAELRAALRKVRDGLDAYKAAFDAGRIERRIGASGYPPDLDTLVKGVPDLDYVSLPMLLVAGLLVGFGTRLGSGCTSGHGVCGVSRFSQRSLVATATFMAAGIVTVLVLRMAGAIG